MSWSPCLLRSLMKKGASESQKKEFSEPVVVLDQNLDVDIDFSERIRSRISQLRDDWEILFLGPQHNASEDEAFLSYVVNGRQAITKILDAVDNGWYTAGFAQWLSEWYSGRSALKIFTIDPPVACVPNYRTGVCGALSNRSALAKMAAQQRPH